MARNCRTTSNVFDLSGRLALVTGSSRGLGMAFATALAEAGAQVVLNGRNRVRTEHAVHSLRARGLQVFCGAFDVTDSHAIDVAVARIERVHGPIDILVNNAGIQRRQPVERLSDNEWDAVIDTNLTSAFKVSRAVGRRMIRRGRGKIINICSLMSEVARPTTANYAASKGGVKMLTKALASEWGKHGIQVNGIGPGYIRTDMTAPLYRNRKFSRWICGRTPAGRWGEPGDLAGTVVYLASSASDFVTGQVIYVDGGILATI